MKQSEFVIVPMEDCHVPAIAELEKICFNDPWIESSIRSELTNPLSLWLVALENDKVIGYVGSQTVLDESDVMNVAVAPEHRRKGLARELFLRLESLLKEKKVHSLTLEVRASNEAAQALYEGLGYVQVGRRPNYYRNPKEDALILRKEWEVCEF